MVSTLKQKIRYILKKYISIAARVYMNTVSTQMHSLHTSRFKLENMQVSLIKRYFFIFIWISPFGCSWPSFKIVERGKECDYGITVKCVIREKWSNFIDQLQGLGSSLY